MIYVLVLEYYPMKTRKLEATNTNQFKTKILIKTNEYN